MRSSPISRAGTSPATESRSASLRRVGTALPSSQTALASRWSRTRADPNGYYRALGLDPGVAWGMLEIERAFRAKMREHHPDVGDGDTGVLLRARQAHAVLSDPADRALYDELGPDDRWMDDETRLEQEKRIRAQAIRQGIDPDEGMRAFNQWAEAATEELLRRVQRKVGRTDGPAEQVPSSSSRAEAMARERGRFERAWAETGAQDGYAYYLVEGDGPPPALARRELWFAAFAFASRLLGREPSEMRVGFSDRPAPFIDRRAWGEVWFVPSGWRPDVSVALALLRSGERTTRPTGPLERVRGPM